MKEIFQQVQDSFMELGIVLSGIDLEKELGQEEIDTVYFSLADTYKLFDQGLCEVAYVCQKCRHNKEELYKLVEMIRLCTQTGRLDKVSNVALVEFMYIIPQVLAELKTIYLENLQKHKT